MVSKFEETANDREAGKTGSAGEFRRELGLTKD
jgi:hypothetical protein